MQSPRGCSGDGVTVRCAAAAPVMSFLSTDDQIYADFPAFQYQGGRRNRG